MTDGNIIVYLGSEIPVYISGCTSNDSDNYTVVYEQENNNA